MGLDFWPKKWEFRVFAKQVMFKNWDSYDFAKQAMSKKLGLIQNYFSRFFWSSVIIFSVNLNFKVKWNFSTSTKYNVVQFKNKLSKFAFIDDIFQLQTLQLDSSIQFKINHWIFIRNIFVWILFSEMTLKNDAIFGFCFRDLPI